MRVAPDASYHDGLLDVVILHRVSRTEFVRVFPRVFKGTHVRNPAVRVLRGAEVRVESDRPFVVYADGDPIGETPITLRAAPGASG